jgi:thioredoxin-related protein
MTEINWLSDFDQALKAAQAQAKPVLLQFHRDQCAGCKKLIALTYPDEQVGLEINQWFIPIHLDIIHDRQIRSRFSAYWTPSFYFLDYHGNLFRAFNGYLNAEDFRVLLRLGKAAINIPRGKYLETIDLMDDGLGKFPTNPRAAEMLFTRGMAEYLLGREKSTFRGTMNEICQDYPNSPEARMWPWIE